MAEKKRSYRNGYRGRQSGRAKGKKPIGRSAKVRDKRQLIIVVSMVVAVVLLAVILFAQWKKVHPILLIVGSAVVGIAAGYAGLLPGV